MGAMNSNTAWHKDLNIPETGGKLGIVSAIYTVGNITGSFFAGPLSDRWGRRWGMFIGSWVVIVGVIIMTTATGAGSYMAGRFLGGLGVAVARSSAPAFVTEISPPQWRGPATLMYNSLWIIGAILASGVAYGTGPMKSSLSWKLPIILQVIPSTIVAIFVFFLPESPRWLIANDRYDEARELLAKYHAFGNQNSPLVTLEMAEMRASIRQEASDKRWYDYSELMNSRSNRYRTMLNLSIAFIGKSSLRLMVRCASCKTKTPGRSVGWHQPDWWLSGKCSPQHRYHGPGEPPRLQSWLLRDRACRCCGWISHLRLGRSTQDADDRVPSSCDLSRNPDGFNGSIP